MEAPGLEMAFFTENARQDRHWHEQGTEIYTVLEGRMKIEVDGDLLELECRDSIVVRPPAVHYIPPGQGPFLCQVVVPFCGGTADKFLADE
jgi:mannose-6-phosphate isomerase-like protein (cupin superfamily)